MTAWSTRQLAEFLEVVSAFETEETAALGAVKQAAEALGADVVAIIAAGQDVASITYPNGAVPLEDLRAVAYETGHDLPVPGAGRCAAVSLSLDHPADAKFVVARSGTDGLGSDEMSLLHGMAPARSTTMRILRSLDDERAARTRLQVLLDEQTALRQVATLVANRVPDRDVLTAVANEARHLADADFAQVIRYEPYGALTVALCGSQPGGMRVGARHALDGHDICATVLRTGAPTRMVEPAQTPESGEVNDLVCMRHPADVRRPATNGTERPATARHRAAIRSTLGIPIVVDGRIWGAVITRTTRATAMPKDTEQRISGFNELAARAISNAQASEELAAALSRAVVASDEDRRRLGRELHDGVQQRLASLALTLRTAQAVVPRGSDELGSALSQVAKQLQAVFDELQDMASDLYPSILSQAGLAPALRMICSRAAVPVEVDMHVDGRLPDSVEIAAYHIVSEALANAVNRASASRARVGVKLTDGSLRVDVRDDGVGRADRGGGSIPVGVRDRVAAVGGKITQLNSPGGGTAVIAEVPIDVQ